MYHFVKDIKTFITFATDYVLYHTSFINQLESDLRNKCNRRKLKLYKNFENFSRQEDDLETTD